MFNISNADLGFSVGGTERLRIESGGIIKSSGPLHINPDGDISKDTFRLTSNASYDAALLMNSNT